MPMLQLFCALCIGHALADYPLQGGFLAAAKNHRRPTPGVPPIIALSAHAAIHAGMVWAATGHFALGACEFVAHTVIDFLKCDGRLSFTADQVCHVACKALWILFLLASSGVS